MTAAETPDPPASLAARVARACANGGGASRRGTGPGLLPRSGRLRLPSLGHRLPPDPGLVRGRLGALQRGGSLRPLARRGPHPSARGGRCRPGGRAARVPRHPARSTGVHLVSVRVVVQPAQGRGTADPARADPGGRIRHDPARCLRLQRAVPARQAGAHRLALLRACRGRPAVGGLSPVLRALPGPAGAHVARGRAARGAPPGPPRGCPAGPGGAPAARPDALLAEPRAAHPPPRPRPAPARRRRPCRDRPGSQHEYRHHVRVAAGHAHRVPAQHHRGARLGPGGHRLGRLCRAHQLRRRGHRRQGGSRGRCAGGGGWLDRLGPRCQHGPLQPPGSGARLPRGGAGRRPRCRRAPLSPPARRGPHRHPAAAGRSHQPQPGAGVGERRAGLAPRPGPMRMSAWPWRSSITWPSAPTCRCP